MKNKKGEGKLEMILGGIISIVILVVFLSSGVFGEIIMAFNTPEFGSFGFLLGVLFILMIIIGVLSKIFEK